MAPPPPDRRPTGPGPRPGAPKGPPPKGARPGPPPTGAAGRPPPPKGGPPPKGPPPKGPAPKGGARKGPPAPAPAPKAFEIRKGERASDEAITEDEDDRPLGQVFLPRSITQEAEDASLKERFGVEHLPEVQQLNTLVKMTDSAGTGGPERSRGKALAIVLILLLVGAGVAVFLKATGRLPF